MILSFHIENLGKLQNFNTFWHSEVDLQDENDKNYQNESRENYKDTDDYF